MPALCCEAWVLRPTTVPGLPHNSSGLWLQYMSPELETLRLRPAT